MTIISLYAIGNASIEIGRYAMSLEDAKESFLDTCAKAGVKNVKATTEKGKIVFTLPFSRSNYAVLEALANVNDLHGDPPMRYILAAQQEIPEGTYVRTGAYND